MRNYTRRTRAIVDELNRQFNIESDRGSFYTSDEIHAIYTDARKNKEQRPPRTAIETYIYSGAEALVETIADITYRMLESDWNPHRVLYKYQEAQPESYNAAINPTTPKLLTVIQHYAKMEGDILTTHIMERAIQLLEIIQVTSLVAYSDEAEADTNNTFIIYRDLQRLRRIARKAGDEAVRVHGHIEAEEEEECNE